MFSVTLLQSLTLSVWPLTCYLCRLRVKPSFGSPGSRLWDRHPAIHVAGSGGRRQEREGSQQSLIKPVITVGACTLIPLGNWKLAWDPRVRATSGTWGIWGIYTLLSVLTGPPRGRYLSCILQPWCFQVNRPWLHEKAPSESAVRSVGAERQCNSPVISRVSYSSFCCFYLLIKTKSTGFTGSAFLYSQLLTY